MKFQDFTYLRPQYEEVKEQYQNYVEQLGKAKEIESFMETFMKINDLRKHVETMSTLASVRYTIDTKDEFQSAERAYWDTYEPLYTALDASLYHCVLASPLLEEAKKRLPITFFQIAENMKKGFSEAIIEDMQLENKTASEYQKLIASAVIEFEGKTYNISQLKAVAQSSDRDLRKRAYDTCMQFFSEHEQEFDDIYDRLVKIRDRKAKKLGFKNYVELGYVLMNRLDYDQDMVQVYRNQVLQDIVPLANTLYEKQRIRLNLDEIAYYDEKFQFASGNPKPHGTPAEMIENANRMYHELSPETGEFFQMMCDQNLMDLVAKPGKASGGYCTFIPEYKTPFIFSNFNGTSGDVDVLTHEAGHAFQVYQSRHIVPTDCIWPTYESCEIHSMTMEFLTHPWMSEFFKEEANKYHYMHVNDAVKFVPYGVLVDHFQHVVYEHPEMTPQERKEAWRQLEDKYQPHKNYKGCDILEKGGWWFQQSHIFMSPFYYIDYTLAQICALQFWKRTEEKDPTVWQDYLALCKEGGTKSFLNLLKTAHLTSPFEEGCVHGIMETCEAYLNTFDDTNL